MNQHSGQNPYVKKRIVKEKGLCCTIWCEHPFHFSLDYISSPFQLHSLREAAGKHHLHLSEDCCLLIQESSEMKASP